MKNKLIEMSNISKTFDGKKYILSDLNFSMEKGQGAIIFGESGCGKSTFLNIVGMMDNFTQGNYVFDGVSILNNRLNSFYKKRADDIGFIFQSYCLIDTISVEENILMPFLYNSVSVDKDLLNNMNLLLERFNIKELSKKKPALLSGGERQRVAIVRAMLKNPKLIIADEPTGNLDENNAEIVINAFKDIMKNGSAVIIVTHNKNIKLDFADKYLLQEGRLYNAVK